MLRTSTNISPHDNLITVPLLLFSITCPALSAGLSVHGCFTLYFVTPWDK